MFLGHSTDELILHVKDEYQRLIVVHHLQLSIREVGWIFTHRMGKPKGDYI
jgi:hypothetical protein